MYFALLSYPILGAGLKYIDDAFDERKFSKTLAIILAPFLGVLGAYTMLIDPVSATILLAIVAGVLLKGKIDNYAHFLGFGIALVIIVIAGVQILILPLIVLAIAALLDEVGNDLIDRKRASIDTKRIDHRIIVAFFDQRWVLKLAILGIALIGIIPIYFFFAMVLFDGAYLLVRWYSSSREELPSSQFNAKIDIAKTILMSSSKQQIDKVVKVKEKPLVVYETRFFGG